MMIHPSVPRGKRRIPSNELLVQVEANGYKKVRAVWDVFGALYGQSFEKLSP